MQDSRASPKERDGQPNAHGAGQVKADACGKPICAEPVTAVSKNHARLISVFRAAPIGIGLVCNRVLMEVNDRLCEMTGYRSEELLGQDARILYPTQEDYDYVGRVKYEQIARCGAGTVETRWKRKDGELLNILLSSTPLDPNDHSKGVTFTALDITHAKQAERRLAESEERYRSMFENAVLGVYRTTPDGQILVANRALLRMLGYDSFEELARRNLEQEGCYAPEYPRSLFKEALQTTGQVIGLESSWIRGDGTKLFVRENARVIRDEQGNALFYEGTVEDITARKKAEEELQNIFNLSLDMVCIVNINTATFAKVNPAFTRTLGYDEAELLSHPFFDFIHPDDVQRTAEVVREKLRAGESVADFENRYRCKDGSYRWLNWASQPKAEQGLAYAVARDITGRKAVEVALRDSETRFRELAELLPQTVFEIDTEGRFTFANRLAFECFGYDYDEMTRLDVFQLFVADDRDRIRQGFRKRLIGKSFEEHECTALRKDGTTFPALLYSSTIVRGGTPTGLRGVVVDITERRHAEQAVQEGKARLESVFESSPEAIAVINGDAIVEDCNQAMLDMFGLRSKEEVLGLSSLAFVAEKDRDQAREVLRRTLRGDSIRKVELTLLRKPGDTFLSEISASVMRSAAGEPMGMVVIAADITERKCAEELIRSERDRAQKYLDVAGVMFIALDKEGKVTLANKKALEILGRDEDEIVGRDWFKEFLPPSAQREIRAVFDRLMSGQLKSAEYFENCVTDRDGQERLVAWHSTVLTNEAGAIIGALSSGQDITERKKAEEALRKSEHLLRESQKVANIGHYALDVGTGRWESSEILDSILGIGEEFCKNIEGWLQIVHPDHRDDMSVYLSRNVLEQHQVFDREYKIVRLSDGQVRWVWGLGRLELGPREQAMRMIGTIQDITERKEAENELQRSNEMLRALIEAAPTAIIGLDLDGNIHTAWNRAAEKMLGWTAEEVMGRFLPSVPMASQEEFRSFRERIRRGLTLDGVEVSRIRKDGTPIDYSIYASPLHDTEGRITGNMAVLVDITERKEAEERLLAYQAKLKSLASELSLAEERERRRIAGDLHDHACQSLALSKMKLQAVLNAALPADEQTLRQICDSLNQTIENVRELTFDLSSPTLYKFGLEAALEELLKDKLKAGHGIRYKFVDDKRPKPLTPDVRVLLFQSVRELLINVIKHAHADEVHLDIRREADSIRIAVGDDGVGFDVARILSAPSGSRGVGLFNIRERLDYVGGQLEIDSRPGCGSRFTLTAPLETEVHVAEENRDGSENPTR